MVIKSTRLCVGILAGLTFGALALPGRAQAGAPSGLVDAAEERAGEFNPAAPVIGRDYPGLPAASPAAPAAAQAKAPKSPFSGTLLNSEINRGLGGNSFTFVHLTDVHIGEGAKDYGTPGFDDAPPSGDAGAPAQKLRETVNWINANRGAQNIAFVIITGDLTDSGEKSEFLKAKEILDTLAVPYIPMIGNHEIWPYTSDTEAAAPVGDEYLNNIFASTFARLKTTFPEWDDGTRLTRAFNSESNSYAYFQNFSFSYKGNHFICADFAARAHAPLGNKGVGPEGDLYNFPGGSWHWFKSHYNDYPGKGSDNMLVFSHYPLTKDIVAGVNSFSAGEYNIVSSFLNDTGNKNSAGAWTAGHVHRDKEYGVRTYSLSTICPGIETGASKEGSLRLITVWGAAQ
jgi:3',5'-cyclic AMP phosphodiesterase CpdA